jgi:hypothetical protein
MPNDKRIGVGYFTVKTNEGVSAASLDAGSALIQGPSAPARAGQAALKIRPFNNEEIQVVREAYPGEAPKMAFRPVEGLPGLVR